RFQAEIANKTFNPESCSGRPMSVNPKGGGSTAILSGLRLRKKGCPELTIVVGNLDTNAGFLSFVFFLVTTKPTSSWPEMPPGSPAQSSPWEQLWRWHHLRLWLTARLSGAQKALAAAVRAACVAVCAKLPGSPATNVHRARRSRRELLRSPGGEPLPRSRQLHLPFEYEAQQIQPQTVRCCR